MNIEERLAEKIYKEISERSGIKNADGTITYLRDFTIMFQMIVELQERVRELEAEIENMYDAIAGA